MKSPLILPLRAMFMVLQQQGSVSMPVAQVITKGHDERHVPCKCPKTTQSGSHSSPGQHGRREELVPGLTPQQTCSGVGSRDIPLFHHFSNVGGRKAGTRPWNGTVGDLDLPLAGYRSARVLENYLPTPQSPCLPPALDQRAGPTPYQQ